MSENKGQRLAGNHEQQWVAGLSMFSGRKEKAKGPMEDRLFPVECKKIAAAPLWHPAIQSLDTSRTTQDCGSSTARGLSGWPEDRPSPLKWKNHRAPLASGDSMLKYVQNVAELWLPYGTKSLKYRDFLQCEILHR